MKHLDKKKCSLILDKEQPKCFSSLVLFFNCVRETFSGKIKKAPKIVEALNVFTTE
jgi:hypothetical protein